MMYGIIFRGKHSYDIGNIIVKTKSRPPIAPVKQLDEEIPYKDGNVDYSDSGGRLFYQDKVIEIDFTFIAKDLIRLNQSITKFVSWMAGGYGELRFDDMPYTIWYAKPINLNDIEHFAYKNGKFTAQFRCKPFNSWIFNSEGIRLGDAIRLDSNVPLGFGNENKFTLSKGVTEHSLFYYGTAPVRPTIEISQYSGDLSITVNNDTMSTSSISGSPIVIDCEKRIITRGGLQCTTVFKGDFFELQPCDNRIIVIANKASSSNTVEFKYKHKFLYGDDF